MLKKLQLRDCKTKNQLSEISETKTDRTEPYSAAIRSLASVACNMVLICLFWTIISAVNLETVCASEPPPPTFSVLFLTPKCFSLINIEWRNGVFQGIVSQIVAVILIWSNFWRLDYCFNSHARGKDLTNVPSTFQHFSRLSSSTRYPRCVWFCYEGKFSWQWDESLWQ